MADAQQIVTSRLMKNGPKIPRLFPSFVCGGIPAFAGRSAARRAPSLPQQAEFHLIGQRRPDGIDRLERVPLEHAPFVPRGQVILHFAGKPFPRRFTEGGNGRFGQDDIGVHPLPPCVPAAVHLGRQSADRFQPVQMLQRRVAADDSRTIHSAQFLFSYPRLGRIFFFVSRKPARKDMPKRQSVERFRVDFAGKARRRRRFDPLG